MSDQSERVVTLFVEELHKRMKAQGVKRREDIAFKCVMCGTVQSIASFLAAGVDRELAEKQVGFSCVGRHTDAGPYRHGRDASIEGCDWSLGGLFRVHLFEVLTPDGEYHPIFELATREEAQQLEARHAAVEARQ